MNLTSSLGTPYFSGKDRSRKSRSAYPMRTPARSNFGTEEEHAARAQSQGNRSPSSSPEREPYYKRHPIKTTIFLGMATLGSILTGVGAVGRNVNPKHSIAKVYGVAGAGPVVAKSLLPSHWLVEKKGNGYPVYTTISGSLTDFKEVGTVYENGLVVDHNGPKGALVKGSDGVDRYYNEKYLKGTKILTDAGNATIGPNDVFVGLTDNGTAVADHIVYKNGQVRNPSESLGGYHQKQGVLELIKEGDPQHKNQYTQAMKAFAAAFMSGTNS
jgi:hypothetical protein